MIDSIKVLPPGWRATAPSGASLIDAILLFFDGGTNNPRIVYSDPDLTTALGVKVRCNSGGMPVTSADETTLIYTGNTPYKIRITSASLLGGTVFEYDNITGALDTHSILVVAASSDRNILAADKGKLISCNSTAVALTMSLAPATVLGADFCVGFRHEGDANWVNIIAGNGTDLISYASAISKSITLTGKGHTIWVACDGVGFKVYAETPALISNTVGVIRIVDRLSAPPVTPPPGGRYIVTAAPSGAWSTFAENDIAEFGFYGWFKYTPPLDCGWLAYVQSNAQFYCFRVSAWTIAF